MPTSIAIHGENGFARHWPSCAAALGVEARRVNAYGASLWQDLEGCTALLWNVNQENPTDLAFARSILLSVEQRGIRVYPDHRTVWHFDDKVAQKYLLESVGAPLAETWVFFDRREAEAFLRTAHFPLVFKLRRGAGSLNVRLVANRAEGLKLVRRMFGSGVRAFPPTQGVMRAVKRAGSPRPSSGSLFHRARRAAGTIVRRLSDPAREYGYVLFQRLIEGNTHDTRVTVIGDRAFVYTREVRQNDFRASGSGLNTYLNQDQIPLDMVDVAFDVTRIIGAQSLALDFVRDPEGGGPVLLEVSYTFIPTYIERCPGFFTRHHEWHSGTFRPPELILRDLLNIRAE